MKYYSRLKQYKASNVLFDCETQKAWSYRWWLFYTDGVFNATFYSASTVKHQLKMYDVLRQENLGVVLKLTRTKKSLTDLHGAIKDERDLMLDEIRLVRLKLEKLKNKLGPRAMSYRDQIEYLSSNLINFDNTSRRFLSNSYNEAV